MITKIEIDGFKTFEQFALELEPFHVIVGTNASGKSNLFDAMALLSRLSRMSVAEAFKNGRGTEKEQFTQLSNGEFVDVIKLAVEVLLDKVVKDSYGEESNLKYTRLRYELTIRRQDKEGFESLHITDEKLSRISKSKDQWYSKHFNSVNNKDYWVPESSGGAQSLLYKNKDRKTKKPAFFLRQDGEKSKLRTINSKELQKSVLSGVNGVEYPHAYGVKQALIGWNFLNFNPEEIRRPSTLYSPSKLSSEGKNLAAVLNRLKKEDRFILRDISRDLTNLIPNISDIFVEANQAQDLIEVKASIEDGNTYSLPLLSEGTLRLLALITIKHDFESSQVLFFEEPENGVHVTRLRYLLDLLAEMTTNFQLEEASEYPLRQVIINTHSSKLIQVLWENVGNKRQLPGLAICELVTRIHPGKRSNIRLTKMTNLEINYGVNPTYETSPRFLIAKIDRLLGDKKV